MQRRVLVLQNASFGPAVKRLQEHLGQLGVGAGTLDRDFGSQPEHAVKEFQRRLGFLPNGMVEPKTSPAIQSAFGSSLPGATSWLKMFKTIQDALFAEKAADLDRLAFLDRGMDEVKPGDFPLSPRAEIRRVAAAKSHARHPLFLADQGHGVTLVSTADPMDLFQPDIQQSVFAFTGPAGLRFHGG